MADGFSQTVRHESGLKVKLDYILVKMTRAHKLSNRLSCSVKATSIINNEYE